MVKAWRQNEPTSVSVHRQERAGLGYKERGSAADPNTEHTHKVCVISGAPHPCSLSTNGAHFYSCVSISFYKHIDGISYLGINYEG